MLKEYLHENQESTENTVRLLTNDLALPFCGCTHKYVSAHKNGHVAARQKEGGRGKFTHVPTFQIIDGLLQFGHGPLGELGTGLSLREEKRESFFIAFMEATFQTNKHSNEPQNEYKV